MRLMSLHNPPTKYKALLVDPPWSFLTRSAKGKGRSAERHYQCLSLDDIKALPVSNLASKDCILFLWTTHPMLKNTFSVLEAWGFEYKTVAFTWIKTYAKSGKYFVGMGYWTRANPELCLLATKGRPKRLAKDVQELIVSPVREHSRKPDEIYDRIERLVEGPYLELFARCERPGWDVFGNEVDKFEETKYEKHSQLCTVPVA